MSTRQISTDFGGRPGRTEVLLTGARSLGVTPAGGANTLFGGGVGGDVDAGRDGGSNGDPIGLGIGGGAAMSGGTGGDWAPGQPFFRNAIDPWTQVDSLDVNRGELVRGTFSHPITGMSSDASDMPKKR